VVTAATTSADFFGFKTTVSRLCTQFERHKSTYRSTTYDEVSLRIEYLDAFFEALGWDVSNKAGVAPHLREVVVENRTHIGRHIKRADYVFNINAIPKFVVEAKNPRERVDRSAFQVQNYAYHLRLYLGLATNFDDLLVYPVPGLPDRENPFKPALTLHFKEFDSAAQRLWDLFARENVASGSIEKFLQHLPKAAPRGSKQLWLLKPDRRKPVDHHFLTYLEGERAQIAKFLHDENPNQPWAMVV